VHPDLQKVIELQQVDLTIAELSTQIDALPAQIQRLEALLSDFLKAHEEKKLRLVANQKERKDLEGEVQVIRQKISKHKDQLYEVKTNEQYRAMLKEIEGEEGNISKIEDRILEKILEAEDLQKCVAEAGARIEGEKSRVAAETRRLESERQKDLEERERLRARREELAAGLADGIGNLYERIRRGRRGLAVAEVREGMCTACNVLLRPQLYNEVRTNEAVHTCDNCARILYYVEPPAAASEPVGEAAGRGAEPAARN
jgi:predicted  nucleic acid-binding Zn-ribbon protein